MRMSYPADVFYNRSVSDNLYIYLMFFILFSLVCTFRLNLWDYNFVICTLSSKSNFKSVNGNNSTLTRCHIHFDTDPIEQLLMALQAVWLIAELCRVSIDFQVPEDDTWSIECRQCIHLWVRAVLSGLILGLRPAYEKRRYFVAASLISWVQA